MSASAKVPRTLLQALRQCKSLTGHPWDRDEADMQAASIVFELTWNGWASNSGADHLAILDAREQRRLRVVAEMHFWLRLLYLTPSVCPEAVQPDKGGRSLFAAHVSSLLNKVHELVPEAFGLNFAWEVLAVSDNGSLGATLAECRFAPDSQVLRPEVALTLREHISQPKILDRAITLRRSFLTLEFVANGGPVFEGLVLSRLAHQETFGHLVSSASKSVRPGTSTDAATSAGGSLENSVPEAHNAAAARRLLRRVADCGFQLPAPVSWEPNQKELVLSVAGNAACASLWSASDGFCSQGFTAVMHDIGRVHGHRSSETPDAARYLAREALLGIAVEVNLASSSSHQSSFHTLRPAALSRRHAPEERSWFEELSALMVAGHIEPEEPLMGGRLGTCGELLEKLAPGCLPAYRARLAESRMRCRLQEEASSHSAAPEAMSRRTRSRAL